MVKLGNKEVVFSSSFVMDKHHDNSASFTVPNQPLQGFELKVVDKPADNELPTEMWHHHELVDGKSVFSFDVLPEGKSMFYAIGIGQADQGFDVQVVRQAIWNNVSMLVHVIVLREPR